jgi:hypothetical protein
MIGHNPSACPASHWRGRAASASRIAARSSNFRSITVTLCAANSRISVQQSEPANRHWNLQIAIEQGKHKLVTAEEWEKRARSSIRK